MAATATFDTATRARGLLRRLRWWLLRRRSEAILRGLEPRLRRDTGLAESVEACGHRRILALWEPGLVRLPR
jgi:hypothetical protein